MPIVFSTSLERDLVYTQWSGKADLMLFREAFAAYLVDKHYRPGRTELINFTDVKGFDADFRKIWSALRMVNDQKPGTKVATRTVLIAPGDVIYGLSRMYQALADNAKGIRVEVYRTDHEALAALDLPYRSVPEMLRREVFLPHEPVSGQP